MRKKYKVGGIIIPAIIIYYNATVIKTVWNLHEKKHIDESGTIMSLEINQSLCGELIFVKGGRSIKWSKNSLFNKCCWEIWIATCEKLKVNLQLTPYTKINSRWINELNISCNIVKVLEENMGRKILNILQSNIFTNMSSRARDRKEIMNKWDVIKIKILCSAKENFSKMKREPILWENIFANDTSDKFLMFKIYKELT